MRLERERRRTCQLKEGAAPGGGGNLAGQRGATFWMTVIRVSLLPHRLTLTRDSAGMDGAPRPSGRSKMSLFFLWISKKQRVVVMSKRVPPTD